jgi:hypothetical protein
LAARLQALADPDNVVVAASTRRLVCGLFETEELGARELKGMSLPSRIWRVASKCSAATRFEAVHATGSVKLVGRDQESHYCSTVGSWPKPAIAKSCYSRAKRALVNRASARPFVIRSPAIPIAPFATSARRFTQTVHCNRQSPISSTLAASHPGTHATFGLTSSNDSSQRSQKTRL